MRIPLSKFIALSILFALQGFGASAWAQDKPKQTAAELQIVAGEMGKQTFKRKDGQVLSFEKIQTMSDKEKEIIFDDEMTTSEFFKYSTWQKQKTASINAEAEETKRRTNGLVEEFAIKLRLLASARAAQGKRLPKHYYDAVKEYADQKKSSFELKPETSHYFESLLANPDAFDK